MFVCHVRDEPHLIFSFFLTCLLFFRVLLETDYLCDMFADIEKAFDTAFFNADHNLKNVHQVISSFEDVVLSEDLTAALGGAMSAIGTQLSTMAFCFAQLMCKSILYSENYFVIKVSLK